MLFNFLLFLSQVGAQVDASNQQMNVEGIQHLVEVTNLTNEYSPDNINADLCGEIKGRPLFRRALIGIPLGTVLTLGGGIMWLATIDSDTSVAVGTVFTGLGTLAFSSVALPTSVHMLHLDATAKEVSSVVPLGMLYLADGMIGLGFVLGSFVPPAVVAIPLGYFYHGILGTMILDAIHMERKDVCTELD